MEVIVRDVFTKLATPPIFVSPDWDAVADGSHIFHVYCDACADGFGGALEQEQPDGSVRSITYISQDTLDPGKHWTRLTQKLTDLPGASNDSEAALGARRFCIFPNHKPLDSIGEATTRTSSGGLSFSPRSTTRSSTKREAPTEKLTFCSVCRSRHGERPQWV